MKLYNYRAQKFVSSLRTTFAILCCLNRREELSRLIKWAEAKQLAGPCRAYQFSRDEVDRRLFHYRFDTPRLMTCARVLHGAKRLLFPRSRCYRKGSARMYRRRKLDSGRQYPIVSMLRAT